MWGGGGGGDGVWRVSVSVAGMRRGGEICAQCHAKGLWMVVGRGGCGGGGGRGGGESTVKCSGSTEKVQPDTEEV